MAFDLAYLLEPRPGPPGALTWLYLPLALLFLAQLAASTVRRPPGTAAAAVAAAGLVLVAARLLEFPHLGARLWALAAAAVLGGVHLQRRLPAGALRRAAQRGRAGLAWQAPQTQAEPLLAAAQYLAHLVLLALVLDAIGWPVAAAPLVVGGAALLTRGRYPEVLTPLGYLYAVVVARSWLSLTFRRPLPVRAAFEPPGLSATLLDVEGALVIAGLWALGAWAAWGLGRGQRAGPLGGRPARPPDRDPRQAAWQLAPLLLMAAGLVWATWTYLGHATAGVTGSDPYAYAQMAVDLATRGTPLHRFEAFRRLGDLPVGWAAFLPPGYHLPINALGDAPTVWPVGASVLLALPYRLAGETGLHLTTPLLALAGAAATFGLGRDLLGPAEGAVAAVLLLTSFELLDRSLVPMADPPALLLTVLAVWMARRRRPVAAGLALAAAYHVRHTQVLAILPVAILLWGGWEDRAPVGGHRWRPLAVAGGVALLAALPDFAYHAAVFGHPLAVESQELKHFSLAAAPHTLARLGAGLSRANEFGYLWPAALLGLAALRRRPRLVAVLVAWVLGHVVFQAWYTELRPRDLLPAWPPLLLLASAGLLWPLRAWRGWARAAAVFLLLALPAYRLHDTVGLAWSPLRASFGYVDSHQRQGFAGLAARTQPGAYLATSLNAGPIELYTQLVPFRPALWAPAELEIFLEAAEGPVYLIMDGEELRPVLRRLALEPVARLELPHFGNPKADAGTLYRVRGSR